MFCPRRRRELKEETGLDARMWLCGTVIVDVDEIGICLFVFSGESFEGELMPSNEGAVEWVAYDAIKDMPVC